MNRRKFIGITTGTVVGGAALAADSILNMDYSTTPVPAKGPYSIEIVSPPKERVRELPLFDSYKQAENFAQARMHLLRQQRDYDGVTGHLASTATHEAGIIKVWSAKGQVVFECAWGETWTQATSYVDVNERYSV